MRAKSRAAFAIALGSLLTCLAARSAVTQAPLSPDEARRAVEVFEVVTASSASDALLVLQGGGGDRGRSAQAETAIDEAVRRGGFAGLGQWQQTMQRVLRAYTSHRLRQAGGNNASLEEQLAKSLAEDRSVSRQDREQIMAALHQNSGSIDAAMRESAVDIPAVEPYAARLDKLLNAVQQTPTQ